MKIGRVFLLLVCLSILTPVSLSATPNVAPLFSSANLVQIGKDSRTHACLIKLNQQTILSFDCAFSYEPRVLAHFNSNVEPFHDVIVIQESPMGSACNGGPLHIIGLGESNRPHVFEAIDFCGGVDPVLRQVGGEIRIFFPGGPPNLGESTIPEEVWILDRGDLFQEKHTAK